MSILYRLFGKPQDFEELLDKAQRRNTKELDVGLVEGFGLWAKPIAHQDVPRRYSDFFQRHTYSTYALVACSDKIHFVQYLGDVPFYSDLYLKLAEKVGIDIKAIEMASRWGWLAKERNITLKLKFNPDDCSKIISELKMQKTELEKYAVRTYKKHHTQTDRASSNAFLRLTGHAIQI